MYTFDFECVTAERKLQLFMCSRLKLYLLLQLQFVEVYTKLS